MLPAPQGQEPRWQRQANESSQPPKDALRLKVGRHNSAGGSGRAGDEPPSLQPGAGHQDPHPNPAAVPCSGTTFCQARPWALGSCLETPPKPPEQSWEFCFAVKSLISLRVRRKHMEQWCLQECHQGRGQPHSEHQQDGTCTSTSFMASALEERHTGEAQGWRGHKGTTDFIKVIATDQDPAGHLGHQLAQTEYLFLRPPGWGGERGGSVLPQLLPFTASTMAPRTMTSVCSASV